MKKLITLSIPVALMLLGCNNKEPTPPAERAATPSPEVTPPPKPAFTAEMWRNAFRSTYNESQKKIKDSGNTEYMACFKLAESDKCKEVAFGVRDGFRKIDFITPPYSQLAETVNAANYVHTYISAAECKSPSLFVAPSVNRQGSWLFLNQVAFMADGDVVFEKSFGHTDVTRDNANRWIHERVDFVATDSEISALKKFHAAKSHIIRLTGDKGYITLDKDNLQAFVKDVGQMIETKELIDAALKNAGGPACSHT